MSKTHKMQCVTKSCYTNAQVIQLIQKIVDESDTRAIAAKRLGTQPNTLWELLLRKTIGVPPSVIRALGLRREYVYFDAK